MAGTGAKRKSHFNHHNALFGARFNLFADCCAAFQCKNFVCYESVFLRVALLPKHTNPLKPIVMVQRDDAFNSSHLKCALIE